MEKISQPGSAENNRLYICRFINTLGVVESEATFHADSITDASQQAVGMARERGVGGSLGYELWSDNRMLTWMRAVHHRNRS